jgi:cytochrome c556
VHASGQPFEESSMSARRSNSIGRALKTAASCAIVMALGLLAGGAANSQPPALEDAPKATKPTAPVASAKPDAQGFIPQFSILEIMESIVMPAAQTIWDSVAVDVTEKGTVEKGPVTDEDWVKLRSTAVTLAESTNLLIVRGRRVAPPGAKSENPDAELSPEQMQELIAKQRPAFVAHARVLHEAAMEALRAIDARKLDAISDAGGTIDAACEGCHLQFWYPNEKPNEKKLDR